MLLYLKQHSTSVESDIILNPVKIWNPVKILNPVKIHVAFFSLKDKMVLSKINNKNLSER